ncbi:hypothetical protein H5410_026396 [Solanum commersonii]|uniref:Uncharacterized protein n=1 Tax=Solanum commersonii TaxID=4109 RepID=A0A9J5YYP1_SOLCO|nr:hypothetical protein H5410_026396 [Solanum commersonii]
MKRKQKSLDCSTCHKSGHNKRTCKTKDVQPKTASSVRDKLHVRRRCSEFLHESGAVWCNFYVVLMRIWFCYFGAIFRVCFWSFSRDVLELFCCCYGKSKL